MDEKTLRIYDESLRRCNATPGFLDRFYQNFLASSPEVKEKFAHTDFSRQKRALRASLHLLALAAQDGEKGSERYLKDMAATHSKAQLNIGARLYDSLARQHPGHRPGIRPGLHPRGRGRLGERHDGRDQLHAGSLQYARRRGLRGMPLESGKRLGPYEIVGPLGAGGMGEVYRARDTRLDREVAVKVLPGHLSTRPELKQRFEREARAVSSLNHPHICTLHDVGREGDVDYLVMELLEGETLAARLEKGPLPPSEVIQRAIEIADALEAAHRQGVVHRDLKPGNIMLTRTGAKLLDFGLSKSAAEAAPPISSVALTQASPLTAEGTIVGTFQYMSPEQLEGQEADARSDIFALGAVIYEMATGRRAFEGKSQATLIAAIIGTEPAPIASLTPMTPGGLDPLVRGCLAKSPEDRWQTAHDVKLQLRWLKEAGSQTGAPAPIVKRRAGRERWAWAATVVFAIAAIALGAAWLGRSAPRVPLIRSSIVVPEGTSLDFSAGSSGALSLSPDGRWMTLSVKATDGSTSLWLRSLDSEEAHPLAGTRGAQWPFWSPDSRYLAFFADGKLKRIDLVGSPAVTVAGANDGRSGSWNQDGVIIFSPTTTTGIHQVPAAGGEAVPVTRVDEQDNETTHRWATFLPDGRHFLYMAGTHNAGLKNEANAVYAGELGSDLKKLVLRARSNVVYASGQLLYVRDRVLLAQPFDPERLELAGEPVPIADQVNYDTGYFRAVFAASEDGLLAYQTGATGDAGAQLAWVDRQGHTMSEVGERGDYTGLALSPDMKKAACTINDSDAGTSDIWIQDLERDVRTRFTFGDTNEFSPVWSPDGTRIAYGVSGRFDHMYVKPSGGGEEQLLDGAEMDEQPTDWSRDGKLIFYDANDPNSPNRWDIWVMPASGDGERRPVIQGDFNQRGGKLSPNGRWILYLSDESGRQELYVAPFPGPGGKWQISNGGAFDASWARNGSEIIYIADQVTSVPVRTDGATFEAGAAKPLMSTKIAAAGAIAPDGTRFLLALRPEPERSRPVSLVLNWPALLKR